MKLLYNLIICCLFFVIPAHATPLKIIASFSVLQNLVEEVGGNLVHVHSIVPPNADPHTYQPTTGDAKNVAQADLIFVNGLGFEGWLDRLIAASGFQGPVITVSDQVTVRNFNHREGFVPDPHAWHNVNNTILYVKTIVKALIDYDPAHREIYQNRGIAFVQKLQTLDTEIKMLFAQIPLEHRKVVSTHDAFWYFGTAYKIKFFSPVGISTEAQASAANVAQLINEIRNHNIHAVFLENLANKKLIHQIAEEAKVAVEGTLYADSLSEKDGPGATYMDMMRFNANTIAKALKRM